MTEQKKDFPEFYVTSPQPCPYLSGRLERKLFTHVTPDKPAQMVDAMLRSGFRRSQNIAYVPYCENCSACISVRIKAHDFRRTRSHRRIAGKNTDLLVRRVRPNPTTEQYSLFGTYIGTRHADGGMASMSALDYASMVEETMVNTFLTEYRLPVNDALDCEPEDCPLIGVTLCDLLSDGISMVYSYFDPEYAARSLGTYMILDHIAYTNHLALPYVYLGYWIEGSRKMAYKAQFKPQEHLIDDGWVPA